MGDLKWKEVSGCTFCICVSSCPPLYMQKVHVQFQNMNHLQVDRITCKIFCHKKKRCDISVMYCVVLAMDHCQSPDPVFAKGHCMLVDHGLLCCQRPLLATSPQSPGPKRGQDAELVPAALHWLSRLNQLRGVFVRVPACMSAGGINTRRIEFQLHSNCCWFSKVQKQGLQNTHQKKLVKMIKGQKILLFFSCNSFP